MEVKKDLIGKKTPSLEAISKKHGISIAFLRKQLAKGVGVEHEHTKSDAEAKEIARDHLAEIPDYYTRLKKMEKEAGVTEMESSGSQSFDEYRKKMLSKTSSEQRKRFVRAHKKHYTDEFDHSEGVFPKGVKKNERGQFTAWHHDQITRERKRREQKVAAWKKRTPLPKRIKYAVTGKHPGWNKKALIPEWDDELERRHNANRERILKGAKEGKYWLLRSEADEERWREALAKVVEDTMAANIGGYNKPMVGSQGDPAFGGRNRFNKKQLRFAIARLLGNKSVGSPEP